MMWVFQNWLLGPLLRRFSGAQDLVETGMSFWSSALVAAGTLCRDRVGHYANTIRSAMFLDRTKLIRRLVEAGRSPAHRSARG